MGVRDDQLGNFLKAVLLEQRLYRLQVALLWISRNALRAFALTG